MGAVAKDQAELSALARNMRAALESSGLSMREAARRIGISQAAMSYYLSAQRCPDCLVLLRFSLLTKRSVKSLLRGIPITTSI